MKTDLTSRRMFLTGATGLLVMPFLPSLLPRQAAAQASPAVTRYVQIIDNFGALRASSMPPGSFTPSTAMGSHTTSRPLSDIISATGRISAIYGAWWNPVASKVNLISNFHAYSSGTHNISHATCACSPTGGDDNLSQVEQVSFPYSLDWVIERAFAADVRPVSAVRANFSSHFKYGSGNSHCFGGQRQVLPALQNFAQLSQRLLVLPPTDVAALERRDFFNTLMGDYRRVMSHPRLSAADRARFGTYADSINDIIRRESVAVQCRVAGTVDATNLRLRNDNALEMIANALACGVTRVASYVLLAGSDTDENLESLHNVHHNDLAGCDALITWRSQRVAAFVAKLDTFKDETGASVLDNTVFYWGHELSNAKDGRTDSYLGQTVSAGAHDTIGYTCILGGGASGRLRTGLHVDAGHAPISRVLVTAMKAAGLTTAQIEQGGVVGFGDYSVPPDRIKQLFGAATVDRFLTDAEKRAPLPVVA